MLPFLALLGFSLLPDPADLDRFPSYTVAYEQLRCCREHRERLLHLRSVHGWQGGIWDEALADLDHTETYWLWLFLARSICSEQGVAQALGALKEHVGPARYFDGWIPVLIPEDERFRPLWPAPPAPAGPREPSGANAR